MITDFAIILVVHDNVGNPGVRKPKFQSPGYIVYLPDGDVPFFRVSFSPIFPRTGYQRRASFLELVVKSCHKRKFC